MLQQTQLENPKAQLIASQVSQAARQALGDKLHQVILFGSYARGDYDHESDIDFLVLADIDNEGIVSARKSIQKSLGTLGLELDILISFVVDKADRYNEFVHALPFYTNVKNEGIPLYA